MRYTDAKCRLCRREGEKLYLKGAKCFGAKCPMSKRGTAPGLHGGKFRKKLTEYGRQLREKQKAKRIYGINEKQSVNYYKKASKSSRANIEYATLLETRADNVLYRSGLAHSRSQARQMISHGFFRLNGKSRITVPSVTLKEGDYLEIDASKKESPLLNQEKIVDMVPGWVEVDNKNFKISILRKPDAQDVSDIGFDSQSIIEFYSR